MKSAYDLRNEAPFVCHIAVQAVVTKPNSPTLVYQTASIIVVMPVADDVHQRSIFRALPSYPRPSTPNRFHSTSTLTILFDRSKDMRCDIVAEWNLCEISSTTQLQSCRGIVYSPAARNDLSTQAMTIRLQTTASSVSNASHNLHIVVFDGCAPKLPPVTLTVDNIGHDPHIGFETQANGGNSHQHPRVFRSLAGISPGSNSRGTVGFPCHMQFGGSNANGNRENLVILSIERHGGSEGGGFVQIRSLPRPSEDLFFNPITRVLSFEEGETVINVTLRTHTLPVGASTQVIHVQLSTPTGIDIDSAAANATIYIYPSVSRGRFLSDVQTAVCQYRSGPAWQHSFFAPDWVQLPSKGPGAVDAAQLSAVITALERTIPESRNGSARRHAIISNLFSIALTRAYFGSDVDIFNPLPQLLQAYSQEHMAKLRGNHMTCPYAKVLHFHSMQTGIGASGLSAKRAASLYTLFEPAFRDFIWRDEHIELLLNLESASFESKTGTGCHAVLISVIRESHWFTSPRHIFDTFKNEQGSIQPLRFLNDQIIMIELPRTEQTLQASFSEPLLLRMPKPATIESNTNKFLCVHWDKDLPSPPGVSGSWSSKGCVTQLIPGSDESLFDGNDVIECKCTEAFFFAVTIETATSQPFPLVSNISFAIVAIVFFIWAIMQCTFGSSQEPNMKLQCYAFFTTTIASITFLMSSHVSKVSNRDGCAAMGVIVHFALLVHFCHVVFVSWHTYRVVRSGDTSHFSGLVTCWLLPVIVVMAYIAIHRGVLTDSFSGSTYGLVRGDLQFCFIPQRTLGAWLVTILPFALGMMFLLPVLRILLQSTWKDWGRYDDLFRGRTNTEELTVRILLIILIATFWICTAIAVLVDTHVGGWLQLCSAILCCLSIMYIYLIQRSNHYWNTCPLACLQSGTKSKTHTISTVAPNEFASSQSTINHSESLSLKTISSSQAPKALRMKETAFPLAVIGRHQPTSQLDWLNSRRITSGNNNTHWSSNKLNGNDHDQSYISDDVPQDEAYDDLIEALQAAASVARTNISYTMNDTLQKSPTLDEHFINPNDAGFQRSPYTVMDTQL